MKVTLEGLVVLKLAYLRLQSDSVFRGCAGWIKSNDCNVPLLGKIQVVCAGEGLPYRVSILSRHPDAFVGMRVSAHPLKYQTKMVVDSEDSYRPRAESFREDHSVEVLVQVARQRWGRFISVSVAASESSPLSPISKKSDSLKA